jgi:2-polyprenyl-3-methyl-5-hydroxy-6-metoxy-1,4-benzoquinol methylase
VTRGAPKGRADHYSYAVYADAGVAEQFDARRFGGPIGALLAEAQERALVEFVGAIDGRSVLDVGTGTGRAAIALARRGARVTGLDASAEMLAVARRRAAAAGAAITWTPGDAHALPFPDRSFDVVVCLRVLMHAPDWRRALAELCRVADGRVVFDYPALPSAAALQSVARRVAAAAGRRVEAYRVLRPGVVRRELARHGFDERDARRQFVLPIALHKAVGSRALTERVEGALRTVGLLRLFGSPVTVVAERHL